MLGKNFDPFNQRPIAGTPLKPQGKQTLKSGKILNYMFNPEFGEDIKNFRQNHSHFLQLIANIFLQTGLIDASYPGLADPNRLGLRSIILHAYNNLNFTREGLPQVLLFFAFVGSLVVVGLSIVFFILSLGTSPSPTPPAVR